MSVGQQFSFIMDRDIVKRMDRVLRMNHGQVVRKQERDNKDVVYTVERT